MPLRKFVAALLLTVLPVATFAQTEPQKLTAFERAQGWRLLFDGRDTSDWRGFRANKLPTNWQVRGGSLAGAAGAAIVTAAEVGDFELQFDWRVAPGGHGEVFFRVDEDASSVERSGPVMKLAGHGDALGASGFGPPERAITPQFDVWYRSKIVVFGNQVEYYINNERVLSYTIDSADWRAALAASSLADVREFGQLRAGRIALAGDGVEFRNVKVREI